MTQGLVRYLHSGGTTINGYICDAVGNPVGKGTLASFSCGPRLLRLQATSLPVARS